MRLSDSDLGRFTSDAPLWVLYEPLQPYQYAANSPVMAVDRTGLEIEPINLTSEQISSFVRMMATLKQLNHPFVNDIIAVAEGCNSTIHLYTFSRDPDPNTSTGSRHGYEVPIEQFWNAEQIQGGNDNRIGATLQNTRMKRASIADVILASDHVLSSDASGQPLLALLDELHHVFNGTKLAGQAVDHLTLFSFLLAEVRSCRLEIPGVTEHILAQLVDRYTKETTVSKATDGDGRPTKPSTKDE